MNTNPNNTVYLIDSLSFIKQIECPHTQTERREQFSYGSNYMWDVCLDCGYESNHRCQEGW